MMFAINVSYTGTIPKNGLNLATLIFYVMTDNGEISGKDATEKPCYMILILVMFQGDM